MFTVAIIYLAIPIFLALFTFFSFPFVILSAAALICLIFCLQKSYYREACNSDIRLNLTTIVHYWPLLLVSFTIAYLSLAYPINEWDWEKHFAVFDALIKETWPPVIEVKNQIWFLRYYVAWYIVPALVSKIFGSQLLTFAMIFWSVTGLFIALVLAFHNIRKIQYLFIGVLVFFLFFWARYY